MVHNVLVYQHDKLNEYYVFGVHEVVEDMWYR